MNYTEENDAYDEEYTEDDFDDESRLSALQAALKSLEEREGAVRPFLWMPHAVIRFEDETEVEPGKAVSTSMTMCPACGWLVTECEVHDAEDLEIIRLHGIGVHDECDAEGCNEALKAYERKHERGF